MKPIDKERFIAERWLETVVLRLAKAQDNSELRAVDLLEYIRDITDATSECKNKGVSDGAISSVVEDTFGAWQDKEMERNGNSKKL
jgi:hypothetical protein